jgi:hypothetical protein
VRRVEANEFVEQECCGSRKVSLTDRVETAQLGVGIDRRSTCRQAEDEIGCATECVGYATGQSSTRFSGAPENRDVQGRQR